MRVLSVDYGKKRTGLAVTDPLQIVAGGLVTVATSDLMRFITEYCQKEEVETIVFGEPRQFSYLIESHIFTSEQMSSPLYLVL